MLVLHLVEDHKKMHFTQILLEVEVEIEMIERHLEVDTKICVMDIINMKVSFMEVNKETLQEWEVVEVIEANNQKWFKLLLQRETWAHGK